MTAKPTKTAKPTPTSRPVAATASAARAGTAAPAKPTARVAASPVKPSQSAVLSKQASPAQPSPVVAQAPKRKTAAPVKSDELTTGAKVGLCAFMMIFAAGGLVAAYSVRPAPLGSQYSEARIAERQAREQKQTVQAAAERLRAWDNVR